MRKCKPVFQSSDKKSLFGTCLYVEGCLYFWITITVKAFKRYFYLNFKKYCNEKALNSFRFLKSSLRIKMTNALFADLIEVIKMKCIYRFYCSNFSGFIFTF